MRVRRIADGLWQWTGRHPEWAPADGGPDGWEREVACVYVETPGATVLIDPLVPPEEPERFHEALDRDVARRGQAVRILLTVACHRRSADELAARHDAAIGELPAGVEIVLDDGEEKAYWLPGHRTLVFGDVVVTRDGVPDVPRAWVGDRYDEVVASLRPLLDLPVERLLVAHGEPVLANGRAALAAALDR